MLFFVAILFGKIYGRILVQTIFLFYAIYPGRWNAMSRRFYEKSWRTSPDTRDRESGDHMTRRQQEEQAQGAVEVPVLSLCAP